MLENGGFTGKWDKFDEGTKMEDINEDDPRLVDKDFLMNVPMEDAPDLVDKSFGEFVDKFLDDAGIIYKTLEAKTHKSQYLLYENIISVEIKRLPWEKGKINERKTENNSDES